MKPPYIYTYIYDLAGNRTSVQLNGGTPATTTYNAANQITNAGYTYDNAGNLTNDGTAASTYDALNRTTQRGTTTYAYNGDGTLVSQASGGVTTLYTQDLAAPLTQVLQTKVGSATRTDYLYGLNRLASLTSGVKTWYAADALGSVRRTVADAGTPLGVINYDPWGTVESGTVPTFGFTDEVQDAGAGLVNLRARWYSTGQGRFTTQDMWAGELTRPGSFNRYNYTESNPVNRTDPTGHTWLYRWDIVRQHRAEIINAAIFHARPGDGFRWEIVAALMGATVAREQRWERAPKDAWDEFWFEAGFNNNDSTGFANIRPSLAFEIFQGIIPDVPGKFEFKMTAATCAIFSGGLDNDNVLGRSESQYLRSKLKEDNLFTFDLLGINIERGIDRAKHFHLTPSVFNVGNWLWNGVQEPWRIWGAIADGAPIDSDKGDAPGYANGLAMVKDIQQAADVLRIGPLPTYNAYNTSSNPSQDESVFVECQPQANLQFPGLSFVQNPSCGKTPMSPDEFLQEYGDRFRIS